MLGGLTSMAKATTSVPRAIDQPDMIAAVSDRL